MSEHRGHGLFQQFHRIGTIPECDTTVLCRTFSLNLAIVVGEGMYEGSRVIDELIASSPPMGSPVALLCRIVS